MFTVSIGEDGYKVELERGTIICDDLEEVSALMKAFFNACLGIEGKRAH